MIATVDSAQLRLADGFRTIRARIRGDALCQALCALIGTDDAAALASQGNVRDSRTLKVSVIFISVKCYCVFLIANGSGTAMLLGRKVARTTLPNGRMRLAKNVPFTKYVTAIIVWLCV